MRNLVASGLQVLGFGLITAAACLFSLDLGLAVGGACLVVIGYRAE